MGFIYGRHATLLLILSADWDTGVVTIFQYGAGSQGVMRLLGKYIVGSGAMFGCVGLIPFEIFELTKHHSLFMGVGSVIRTDASPIATELWLRSHYPPLVHPRRDLRTRRRQD